MPERGLFRQAYAYPWAEPQSHLKPFPRQAAARADAVAGGSLEQPPHKFFPQPQFHPVKIKPVIVPLALRRLYFCPFQ